MGLQLQNIVKKKLTGDAKVVASNFSWLLLLQIAGYIFPLITLPYLARVVGVDGIGKIAFASSIIIWIQTFADWGFNFTATRDVARNRDDIAKVSQIFSNVLWARCILTILGFLILLILIFLVPSFRENSKVIFLTFLMIPGHICYPDWFFQAIEKMKYTTILNLLSKLFFTVAVFIFVKDSSDYILQPLFTSLGFILSGVFAIFIIRKWGVRLCRPSFNGIIATIKGSVDVFLNNLMPNLYNSFSSIMLGVYGGSVSTGLYSAGSKFVDLSQQFIGIMSRAFFPFLSRKLEKHSLYKKINLAFAVGMAVALFVLAPLLIKLFYGQDFNRAVVLLRILSVSIPFLALANIYGTNYLILIKREKSLRKVTMYVSIFGFIVAFPLVYFFDYVGAAINVCLTRVLLGIGILLMAMKHKHSYVVKIN